MGWFNMNTELKIFKSGNSQAISIKKKTMEEMGLKIGDRLNIEKINDEMILTKKEEKNFEEEWHDFLRMDILIIILKKRTGVKIRTERDGKSI